MALKMALRWKNPDASSDINLRYKDVFNKGFVSGGDIVPSGIALQVDVNPFVLVNFDGAVVVSDATETLNVTDGQVNYVVCRARYRLLDSPILQMQVLTEAAYLADPELDWLHVVAVVDLSSGGPYAFVPIANVFYENRDTVDKQGRANWREPVASFGALPTGSANSNRDGDVRLTLDTGSLYWWKESTQTWEIFDEVPLQNHRDREHVNGITGDSAATTLEPDVAGTDMTIAAVPAGSGYTVDGRFVTAPTGVLNIPASGVGAIRGTIQVAMDINGTTTENFRVQKSADVLDIAAARIVNISDDHPIGTFTLLFTPNTLSWNGGPTKNVSFPAVYRLFGSDMKSWIDVDIVGALPGIAASDNYDVNASLQTDSTYLVGYWFWDGSTTLSLGADKRTFGNLGYVNMDDDFKDNVLTPPWREQLHPIGLIGWTNGNIVSGGDVEDLGGLSVRITGPILAYIEGIRYELPGNYTGAALTDNATNTIYVNEAGVLTISTTGTTGDSFAWVAEVTTAGGVITDIEDNRTRNLVIGYTYPNLYATSQGVSQSNLWFSQKGRIRWQDQLASGRQRVEFRSGTGSATASDLWAGALRLNGALDAGAIALQIFGGGDINISSGDIQVTLGDLRVESGDIYTDGSVNVETGRWTDWGSGNDHRFEGASQAQDIYIARGADQDIGDHMLGVASPSILGGLRYAMEGRKYARGTIDGLGFSRVNDSLVRVASGSLVDGWGRRVDVSQTDVAVSSDNTHIVYWDTSAEAVAITTMYIGLDNEDIPLGVVVRASSVISTANVKNVQYVATGEFSKRHVTVGNPVTSSVDGDNFLSLEAALLYICCFKGGYSNGSFISGDPSPQEIIVNEHSDISMVSGRGINFDDSTNHPWWWGSGVNLAHYRLEEIQIIGKGGANEIEPTVSLSWSTQESGFDFDGGQLKHWTFTGINFSYGGADDIANHDLVVFKNPGRGLWCHRCEFSHSDDLTHLVNWDYIGVNLGGRDTNTSGRSTVFENCNMDFGFPSGAGGSIFYFDSDGASGKLIVRDSYFHSTGFYDYVVDLQQWTGADVHLYFENTRLLDFQEALIRHNIDLGSPPTAGTIFRSGKYIFRNCEFLPAGTAYVVEVDVVSSQIYDDPACDLIHCRITGNTLDLRGCYAVMNCVGQGGARILGHNSAILVGCDFQRNSTYHGFTRAAFGCRFAFQEDDYIQLGASRSAYVQPFILSGCHLWKDGVTAGGTNKMIDFNGTVDNGAFISDCHIRLQGGQDDYAQDHVVTTSSTSVTGTLVFNGCRFASSATVDTSAFLGMQGNVEDLVVANCQFDPSTGMPVVRLINSASGNGNWFFVGNSFNSSTRNGAASPYFAFESTSGNSCRTATFIGNTFDVNDWLDAFSVFDCDSMVLVGNWFRGFLAGSQFYTIGTTGNEETIAVGNYFANDSTNTLATIQMFFTVNTSSGMLVVNSNIFHCQSGTQAGPLPTPYAVSVTCAADSASIVGNVFYTPASAGLYLPTGGMNNIMGLGGSALPAARSGNVTGLNVLD